MNELAEQWFEQQQWKPYAFQQETWDQIDKGKSGLLNAPTGFGKTMAAWFGILKHYYRKGEPQMIDRRKKVKVHCLCITPLRALCREIHDDTNQESADIVLDLRYGLRSGHTLANVRST